MTGSVLYRYSCTRLDYLLHGDGSIIGLYNPFGIKNLSFKERVETTHLASEIIVP